MNKKELLELKVKSIMSLDLITINENELMATADTLLRENNINHLPVVDNHGHIRGILTKNDLHLLKDWGSNLNLKASEKANHQILNSNTAKDRMNATVVTVGPEDTLKHCADIFKKNEFHALPVTVEGLLVGMLTTYDLLNIAYS